MGGENGTEQCHEVERVKQKGDEIMPNKLCRAVEREGALERRRNTGKLTQRTTELSNLIPVTKLLYSRAKASA